MGRPFVSEGGDALRSDLPGIAFRVPGADTQVRLYGFAKLTAWQDFNGRNQTDAPAPAFIPLTGSAADLQGGEFGMGARFSRFGIDTRTLTGWGTLETRIEGDFGGGSPTSSNAVFRLRQAWAELGTPAFRVLVGQANSLWNEGLFETIIDATNLNQSFVRQAQLRVTGRLAPGLTGQVSLEAPETNYVSGTGVFNPGSSLNNGASPAFNARPDLLGRLTYADCRLGVRPARPAAQPAHRHRRHRRIRGQPRRHGLGLRRACADADARPLGALRPGRADRHGLLRRGDRPLLLRQHRRAGRHFQPRPRLCRAGGCGWTRCPPGA